MSTTLRDISSSVREYKWRHFRRHNHKLYTQTRNCERLHLKTNISHKFIKVNCSPTINTSENVTFCLLEFQADGGGASLSYTGKYKLIGKWKKIKSSR